MAVWCAVGRQMMGEGNYMTTKELLENALKYERKPSEGERLLLNKYPPIVISIETYKHLVDMGLIEADDTLPS